KAGGMALLVRELMDNGMLHEDVLTVAGHGFGRYMEQPVLEGDRAVWKDGPAESLDPGTIATVSEPFDPVGGTRILTGNIGRAVMKISALKDGENTYVEAPAMVFHSQKELEDAFHSDKLDRDVVAVVRFQGPRANGMPELHKLIMFLTIIMQRGFKTGLVTDGRLSGASGTVPFAIHCSPEAAAGGNIARIKDGDVIVMDAKNRSLQVKVDDKELAKRPCATADLSTSHFGLGRQIFAALRKEQLGADQGASAIFAYTHED
ncbi:MAG: phosphogluconate dehydratase, partial [Thermodesulfatator sp.]